MINRFRNLLRERGLWNIPGRTFYSSLNTIINRTANRESRLYFMGSNASGDDTALTIGEDFTALLKKTIGYNSYVDEQWGGAAAGEYELQRNVQELMRMLNLDIANVCCSNLILRSTPNLSEPKARLRAWFREGWPIHEMVINQLRPAVIVIYGMTAYDLIVREFNLIPIHRWSCTMEINDHRLTIVGLNHLSWARWRPQNQQERIDLIRSIIDG